MRRGFASHFLQGYPLHQFLHGELKYFFPAERNKTWYFERVLLKLD